MEGNNNVVTNAFSRICHTNTFRVTPTVFHREQNVDEELKAILDGQTLMNLQQLIVLYWSKIHVDT